MMLKENLNKLVEQAVSKAFPKVEMPAFVVESPKDTTHGDFACNVAMLLSKTVGEPPRSIAEKITGHLPENDLIEKVEIAGPGFINFFLKDHTLIKYFFETQDADIALGKGKTAVTDTSHPNIAKPMGVHHLLSTIIGDSINKTLAYSGYNVVRDSFLGDIGTQFGKLIYAYNTWGDRKIIAQNPIPELLKLYVKFHDEAEKDPALEEKGREEYLKLENKDPENRKLWEWMVEISMQDFQKIYQRLHITFDIIHGESFYEDMLKDVIELGKKKGVFVPGEKGALVVNFPNESLPTCVIQKSDGATLYHTRDVARTIYWEKTYHPDLMIMVTDIAQELHFRQLFMMNDMLGITKAKNIHVAFGRMQFKDKKMSTRTGNIILLEEVLDEAVERAKQLMEDKAVDFDQSEKDRLAEIIGIGAVKYGILSQSRTTNIIFDWDKIITLEGNSGPYLQYTYARAMSILRKRDTSREITPTTLEPSEKSLILKLEQFRETVITSCEEFRPNLIANFLYDLTQLFNSFYNKLKVLDAEEEKKLLRIILVERTADTIKTGLGLLGIEVPERM